MAIQTFLAHLKSNRLDLSKYSLETLTTAQIINNKPNKTTTLLHVLHMFGNGTIAEQILYNDNNCKDLNTLQKALSSKDYLGRTPLHIAAAYGHKVLLELYFKWFKTFPNDETKNGRTILHSATKYDQSNVVEYLIEKKPDLLSMIDNKGFTPAELSQHLFHDHEHGSIHTSQHHFVKFFQTNPIILLTKSGSQQDFSETYTLTRDLPHLCNLIDGAGLSFNRQNYLVKLIDLNLFKLCLLSSKDNYSEQPIKIICIANSNYTNINNTIKSYYQNITLFDKAANLIKNTANKFEFYGFSTAGVAAQLLLTALLKQTQNKNIVLKLINSPGINPKVFKDLESSIKNHTFNGQLYFSPKDKVHLLGTQSMCQEHYLIENSDSEASSEKSSHYFKWNNNIQLKKVKKIDKPLLQYDFFANKKSLDTQIDFCQEIEKYPPDRRLANTAYSIFASGEYFFHFLAYKHLEHGSEIPALNRQGKEESFKVFRLHHQEGYYVFAFISKNNPSILKVAFQGTDFGEFASAVRDLDRGSAGYKLFKEIRLKILFKICDILKQYKEIQQIVFGGHSLGGADAQNFFTYFLLALAQYHKLSLLDKSNDSLRFFAAKNQLIPQKALLALEKIKEVDLNVYNAAGVRESTAELSNQIVKLFQVNNKLIKINAYFQIVHKDPVTGVGESYVLSDALHAKDVDIYCLHFHEHKNIATAHTDYHFKIEESTANIPFNAKLYHNKSQNENQLNVVKKILTLKFEPNLQEWSEIKTNTAKALKAFLL